MRMPRCGSAVLICKVPTVRNVQQAATTRIERAMGWVKKGGPRESPNLYVSGQTLALHTGTPHVIFSGPTLDMRSGNPLEPIDMRSGIPLHGARNR